MSYIYVAQVYASRKRGESDMSAMLKSHHMLHYDARWYTLIYFMKVVSRHLHGILAAFPSPDILPVTAPNPQVLSDRMPLRTNRISGVKQYNNPLQYP